MAMSGNSVLLRVNTGTTEVPEDTAVGSQKGLDISKTRNAIDASHKGNDATEYVAGRKSSSVTLDALFVPNDTAYRRLKQCYDNGAEIEVVQYRDGVAIEEADAIVTELSESYPDDDVSTISCSLQVSGNWRTPS